MRAGATRRATRRAPAARAARRATSSPARSTPRSSEGRGSPARRRLPRHRLRAAAPRSIQQKLPGDVPPVQGAGGRRHHQGADGGRPDLPLHDGRRPRGCRDAGVDACRGCSPPARWPAACTAPTAWAATRCPTCSCSASAPASYAAEYAAGARRRADDRRRRRSRTPRRELLAPVRADPTARTPTRSTKTCRTMMQELRRHRPRRRRSCKRRSTSSPSCRPAAGRSASAATASTTPAGTSALDLRNMLDVSEAVARAALDAHESRGGHTREDYPDTDDGVGQAQRRRPQGRRTADGAS